MGTLYWQFNDNWPVASWSSLDYDGTWKILHYAAARFYAPVLLTAHPGENETVEFGIVNDMLKEYAGTFRLKFHTFNGVSELLYQSEVKIPAGESQLILKHPIRQSEKNGFYSYAIETGSGVLRKEYFPSPYKKYELPQSAIFKEIQVAGKGFDVKISSPDFLFFLFAELSETPCKWSDNAVTVYPDETVLLHAEPEKDLSLHEFESELRLTHLRGTY